MHVFDGNCDIGVVVSTEPKMNSIQSPRRFPWCDEMQGYVFSKSVPVEIFETRFLALPLAGQIA